MKDEMSIARRKAVRQNDPLNRPSFYHTSGFMLLQDLLIGFTMEIQIVLILAMLELDVLESKRGLQVSVQ